MPPWRPESPDRARAPVSVDSVGHAAGVEGIRLASLRAGDEAAFDELVTHWSPSMLRVARRHVSTDASAQEVVQETWLAAVAGLERFEGRSSLHTWVFRILLNTAKTRGVQEGRVLPAGSFGPADDVGPTVAPSRFTGPRGTWRPDQLPASWDLDPARATLRGELHARLESAIDALPERQRRVVVLRDIEGYDPDEVCELLDLTPENQRLLLHRGRGKVRTALEAYVRGPV